MSHATLSPSSRYRWSRCPGSVAAIAKYGEGKPSPAAIDGTHTHTLLEYCLKNEQPPEKYIGMVLQDHDGMFAPDADRCARVRVAWDYIQQRVVDLAPATVRSEVRVDPSHLVQRKDMTGTVDVHIVSPVALEIIDYKDGMNPVTAANNEQLEQYAAGIVAGMIEKGENVPEKIILTIVQPKAAIKGGAPISSWETTLTDLLFNTIPAMIKQAEATDALDAPFVPGEKQCAYCPHRPNCTASVKHALDKSGIQFDKGEIVEGAAQAESTEMSDDRLREIIEAAPLLRRMIEDAENEALRRIQSGHPVPGVKAVRGTGRRKWALPEEEVAAKLKHMGVPQSVLWVTSLITPAQTDKLEWQKRDGTVMKLSPKKRDVLENELITRSEGKLSVVPESDSRRDVAFGDLAAMFSPQVQQPEQSAVPDWLS